MRPTPGYLSPSDIAVLKIRKQIGVTITVDKVSAITKAVQELTKQQVLVGIPAESAQRDDGGAISNATIGYLQEFGIPSKNVPARPHLVPGVQKVQAQAIERLKAAAEKALEGNSKGALAQLDAIGMIAVSSVKQTIQDKIPPQLAPRTIKERIASRVKGDSNRKRARRAGLTGIALAFPDIWTPLVNTGDYIKHIAFVIRKVK